MVQPASIDLRLGDSFRVFYNHRITAIDLRDVPPNLTEEVTIGPDEAFVIHPGEFCLGRTLERVELPDDLVARVEGKSSLGRLGLIVHATAGFVDPGWKGTLTLELNNLTRVPIKLYAGLPHRAAQRDGARPRRRAAVRVGGPGFALPGPGRRDREPLRACRFPPMLHAFLIFAAEAAEEEHDPHAPSTSPAALLAVWAVVVSRRRHPRHADWPPEGTARDHGHLGGARGRGLRTAVVTA